MPPPNVATDLLVSLVPRPIGEDGKAVPAAQFFSELSQEVHPAAQPGPPEARGPSLP